MAAPRPFATNVFTHHAQPGFGKVTTAISNSHNVKATCRYCAKTVVGQAKFIWHLAGITGNVKSCDAVPAEVRAQALAHY